MSFICRTCGGESQSPNCDCLFTPLTKLERIMLASFCHEVNRKAEAAMLKTGKLEGAHHLAIQQVCERLGVKI